MPGESQFTGKVVIVTGSSSGIGEGIATKFAEQGASVVVCGRNEERVHAVLEKCVKSSGGRRQRFSAFCGDLREPACRTRLVEQAMETFGRLDVLVTNAGCVTKETVRSETDDSYDKVMDSNLKAVYFLIQAALPRLEMTKGNIVCVSSSLSTLTLPVQVVYQLSKAALDQMVRILALAEGPKGIRVNAINPGVVSGPRLFRDYPDHDYEAKNKFYGATTPLHGRVSTIDEQADVVLFLAGDGARFITGECVRVDGGNFYYR